MLQIIEYCELSKNETKRCYLGGDIMIAASLAPRQLIIRKWLVIYSKIANNKVM